MDTDVRPHPLSSVYIAANLFTDIGSGHYEPLYNNAAPPIPYPQQQQQPMPQQAPQYYGSTDNH